MDLAFSDIATVAPLVERGEVSSLELTEACLERIRADNPTINAFVTILEESARDEAKTADQEIKAGRYRGPLHGIPIAHKDLYYTAGIRTTAGSKILEDFIPTYDATVVQKLKAAGTVLLGKLNTHEFAAGGTTNNPWYGPTRNPWSTDRIPGGSSGGSGAALATGMAFAATGSDTAGSIRIPSHCCGVTGIKPTHGRCSAYGVVPLAWSLDHTGPLTRTVRDAALVLNVIAGSDPQDPFSKDRPAEDFTADLDHGVRGLRIGLPRNYFSENLGPGIEHAWRTAIQVLVDLGAKAVDVTFPSFEQAMTIGPLILRSEMAAYHSQWFPQRRAEYGAAIQQRLDGTVPITATDYINAQRARDLLTAELQAALDQADVIVTPTAPITSPPIGDESNLGRFTQNTYPFNLTRCPALSVPCGFDPDGLPIGLQIAGGLWQESLVLRVGNAFQQATDWHLHRVPSEDTRSRTGR